MKKVDICLTDEDLRKIRLKRLSSIKNQTDGEIVNQEIKESIQADIKAFKTKVTKH